MSYSGFAIGSFASTGDHQSTRPLRWFRIRDRRTMYADLFLLLFSHVGDSAMDENGKLAGYAWGVWSLFLSGTIKERHKLCLPIATRTVQYTNLRLHIYCSLRLYLSRTTKLINLARLPQQHHSSTPLERNGFLHLHRRLLCP